ncbi:hypothetical protein ACQJBY_042800 [Aegilops geniculata]
MAPARLESTYKASSFRLTNAAAASSQHHRESHGWSASVGAVPCCLWLNAGSRPAPAQAAPIPALRRARRAAPRRPLSGEPGGDLGRGGGAPEGAGGHGGCARGVQGASARRGACAPSSRRGGVTGGGLHSRAAAAAGGGASGRAGALARSVRSAGSGGPGGHCDARRACRHCRGHGHCGRRGSGGRRAHQGADRWHQVSHDLCGSELTFWHFELIFIVKSLTSGN